MLSLPPELEYAITQALRTVPPAQWQAAARALSLRYRTADETRRTSNEKSNTSTTDNRQPTTDDKQLRNPQSAIRNVDALGYIGLVLPAAYAQLHGALQATALRIPSFQPTTLLDLGSGPGTALWAATHQFPTLTTLHAYEREPAFISLAKTLAQSSSHPALRSTHYRQLTLTGSLPPDTSPSQTPSLTQNAVRSTQFDLVIIAHALNEMPPDIRDALVLSAWEHCSGLLLIVEPGTSASFPIVLRARDLLIGHGGHSIAPCAHSLPCPLPAANSHDWCHFPQRLQRPQFQRIAKEASAGWEESKFTYAALARFPQESPIYARLLHQPHQAKTGVTLTLSTNAPAIQTPHLPKKHPHYKAATHLDWGDALPENVMGDR